MPYINTEIRWHQRRHQDFKSGVGKDWQTKNLVGRGKMLCWRNVPASCIPMSLAPLGVGDWGAGTIEDGVAITPQTNP